MSQSHNTGWRRNFEAKKKKNVTPQLLWLSFLQDPDILMQGYDHCKDLVVYFNLFLNYVNDTTEKKWHQVKQKEILSLQALYA